jgi:hypothetical protein
MQTRLFEDFLKKIICANNTPLFDYLWLWMAHLIQKPNELPGVALVLQGNQGTEKGLLTGTLAHFIEPENYEYMCSPDQLQARFNSHLANKSLIVIDQDALNEDNYAILKAMISYRSLHIERKGQQAMPAPNYKHIIIKCHDKQCLKLTDRRFVVFPMAEMTKDDFDCFQSSGFDDFQIICEQLKQGGYDALKAKLANTDISMFNPQQIPGA